MFQVSNVSCIGVACFCVWQCELLKCRCQKRRLCLNGCSLVKQTDPHHRSRETPWILGSTASLWLNIQILVITIGDLGVIFWKKGLHDHFNRNNSSSGQKKNTFHTHTHAVILKLVQVLNEMTRIVPFSAFCHPILRFQLSNWTDFNTSFSIYNLKLTIRNLPVRKRTFRCNDKSFQTKLPDTWDCGDDSITKAKNMMSSEWRGSKKA